jgi:hypothetical protein
MPVNPCRSVTLSLSEGAREKQASLYPVPMKLR